MDKNYVPERHICTYKTYLIMFFFYLRTVEAMNMGLDYREALKLRLEMMALTEQQLNDFLREHPISFTPGIE